MKTTLLLSACALGAATLGCVENDQSLTIQDFVALTPPECIASEGSTVFTSSGIVDTTIPNAGFGYILAPIVQNNMFASQSAPIDRYSVQMEGFDVEVKGGPGSTPFPVLTFFAPSGAGRVEPNGGRVIGVVDVLPPDKVRLGSFRGTLMVRVRPFGKLHGGDFRGGWATFPISVCAGCLAGEIFPCPATGYDEDSVALGGCAPAQDLPITCCVSADDTTLCGAQVPIAVSM